MPQPEKLAKLLTLHFAEVEEIRKEGRDFVLDIDIRPNRAGDCFSHLGVAREISAITNLKFREPREQFSVKSVKNKEQFSVAVEVRDKIACPRYAARVLTDVKVGPSPKWLKERLEICGLNSINNIVDIANYVMLETGQPLHAFDGEKLAGKKLIIRFAKNKESIVTLDEQRLNLEPDILVIADVEKPIAIAGIKGGKSSEIDKKTKVVVLESANFNPRVIRKGYRKLGLKTDASLRFEHDLDANLAELAINRAACLIEEVAQGKITKELVDVYPKKVLPKRIKLDLTYVESLLGVKITPKTIKNILERLGCKMMGLANQSVVEVPTRRLDISIPEDLIEEIGRIYGYQKIPAIFPVAVLTPPKRNEEIFWENMTKNILKELGFNEVYNYSFVSEEDAKIFTGASLMELKNPISKEYQYLRPSLIPNLLKNVEKNVKNISQIEIFELGKVFAENIKEKRQISGVVSGQDFYQLKGMVDLLLQKLGIGNVWYSEAKESLWHHQKSALVGAGAHDIGFLGEISPKILEKMKISTKVVAFDLDFEVLQKLASEEYQYLPLSKFPAAMRDLAVLVPRRTKAAEVLKKIKLAGGKLIKDAELFDIYQGEELPQDKKNLAFHLIFQTEDRTLKPEEINKLHQKIIKTLEEKADWEVRR